MLNVIYTEKCCVVKHYKNKETQIKTNKKRNKNKY